MSETKFFFIPVKGVLLLGGALTLGGCAGYVEGPRAEVQVGPPAIEVASPVIVVQDDYVYYPNYDIYYSSSRHQYAYLEGGAWVARSGPPGVSIDVVLGSPSERRDFHASPGRPRGGVARTQERNSPPRSNPVRKENQKSDQRDDRKGN
jgi:hypothetical protein